MTRTSKAAMAVAMMSGVVLAGSAMAAPKDAALLAPIHTFADGLNKGDMKSAASAYAAQSTIIDEFAPFVWTGDAFQGWGRDFGAFAQKTGTSDPHLTVKAPTRADVDGDHAYVVAPAVFSYKEHGKAMDEPGVMTFALAKGADGWKLAGWSWAGGKPHAAMAAKKKG